MSILEITLIGVGLSMDSLAVSVTGGTVMPTCTVRNMTKIGLIMGLFQASMTFLGFLAGWGFSHLITSFDHWVAFSLLTYLGGKMVYESFRKKECDHTMNCLCNKTLCGLALATSIDALAVGVSLAVIESTIFREAAIIGVITFLFSAGGVYLGNRCGSKVNLRFDLIGGFILILIGIKILIEHLCGYC